MTAADDAIFSAAEVLCWSLRDACDYSEPTATVLALAMMLDEKLDESDGTREEALVGFLSTLEIVRARRLAREASEREPMVYSSKVAPLLGFYDDSRAAYSQGWDRIWGKRR